MVCGCTTKITLTYGVVKLNFVIRLEYCIDCACDLLQVLNLSMCLNRSCTQYVWD